MHTSCTFHATHITRDMQHTRLLNMIVTVICSLAALNFPTVHGMHMKSKLLDVVHDGLSEEVETSISTSFSSQNESSELSHRLTSRILFMRHSIRADQDSTCEDEHFTDKSQLCISLQNMSDPSVTYDPSIRNCKMVSDATHYWFQQHSFIPDVIVTSIFLRTMQTSEVARCYYANSHNHSVSRIIIDHRFPEVRGAIIRDNNGSSANINLQYDGKKMHMWSNMEIEIVGSSDSISLESLERQKMMLDAVKQFWLWNMDVLVVTHDAWLTRLIDMCIADESNDIPRHVAETTGLMIHQNGTCQVRYPDRECHASKFMNRRDVSWKTTFQTFGAMTDMLKS